jgi:hypothetical protein
VEFYILLGKSIHSSLDKNGLRAERDEEFHFPAFSNITKQFILKNFYCYSTFLNWFALITALVIRESSILGH